MKIFNNSLNNTCADRSGLKKGQKPRSTRGAKGKIQSCALCASCHLICTTILPAFYSKETQALGVESFWKGLMVYLENSENKPLFESGLNTY